MRSDTVPFVVSRVSRAHSMLDLAFGLTDTCASHITLVCFIASKARTALA